LDCKRFEHFAAGLARQAHAGSCKSLGTSALRQNAEATLKAKFWRIPAGAAGLKLLVTKQTSLTSE